MSRRQHGQYLMCLIVICKLCGNGFIESGFLLPIMKKQKGYILKCTTAWLAMKTEWARYRFLLSKSRMLSCVAVPV